MSSSSRVHELGCCFGLVFRPVGLGIDIRNPNSIDNSAGASRPADATSQNVTPVLKLRTSSSHEFDVITQSTLFQCKESAKSKKRHSISPGVDDFVGTQTATLRPLSQHSQQGELGECQAAHSQIGFQGVGLGKFKLEAN
jgi:hypothetical protein